MKATAVFAALATCLMLVACGQSEAPKAPAGAKGPTGGPTVVPAEASKEEKPEVPDTHGMPGMTELFKDDEKKDEKKEERKDGKKDAR